MANLQVENLPVSAFHTAASVAVSSARLPVAPLDPHCAFALGLLQNRAASTVRRAGVIVFWVC
jgi:hypothetical protein